MAWESSRRWLPALALAPALLGGCDDGVDPVPFDPIGRPADAAPPAADAAPTPDPEARRLALRFVPIAHDAGALRITDIAFLPGTDGEFVVLDKDGEVIHMVLDGDGARRLGAFRIEDTWSESDAGLISVAADPDFADNRWIYVGVTPSRTTSDIRRYTLPSAGGDYAAAARSAVEVFSVTEPDAPRSWHNVGKIGFDGTGALWALFGDKVIDTHAADPHSPLGALVRIVPRGEGGFDAPDDNPYDLADGHPAVYAKGLRSPWTGFERDGRWFIGDVGLDSHEEINRVDGPGLDFGWPTREGPCGEACGSSTGPWLSYGRSGSDRFVREDPEATSSRLRSVWVAGPRRPGLGPDRYAGRWDDVMLFGDAFVGYVRGRPLNGGDSFHVGHLHFATGFAQGPDGYVYATALGTWPIDAPITPSPILRAELAD